jgi:hypothetical protein
VAERSFVFSKKNLIHRIAQSASLVFIFALLQQVDTLSHLHLHCMWAETAQSAQRLATGWTVRRSNPRGIEFSAPVQTSARVHPAFCTAGKESLSQGQSGWFVALTTHPI